MTRPAESVKKVFHVMDIDGVPITGLLLANFEITGFNDGVSYSHGSTISEISLGYYLWTYNTIPTRGHSHVNIRPTNPDYYATVGAFRSSAFTGEIENQDLDSLYARQARPVVTIQQTGTLGLPQPITLYKERFRQLEFNILDEDGDPILLFSDYNNFRIAVRSADQVAVEWDGTGAVITPDDTGLLTITIPENASFFDALDEGDSETVLYWEVTADLSSIAAQTIAIIPSSTLTLHRSEVDQ